MERLEDQSTNEFLLNALKNKFSTTSDANATNNFNASKLTIPILKPAPNLNRNGSKTESIKGANDSSLNEFILNKLSEKSVNGDVAGTGKFILPKLQFGAKPQAGQTNVSNFKIPALKTAFITADTKHTSAIAAVNSDMQSLKISENIKESLAAPPTTPAIDLTTALSCGTHTPSLVAPKKAIAKQESFSIPFIECPAGVVTQKQLPIVDAYCYEQLPDVKARLFLKQPSTIGIIMCLNYIPKNLYLPVDHSFKTNYNVNRFDFSSSSPDDVTLQNLKRQEKKHKL